MTGTDGSGADDAAAASAPAIQLEGITKSFGAVTACDQVDLVLHRGRIHGVLGENGAGKSTLMKVMIGLVLPDAGSIHVNGERCQIPDPLAAADRGIGMVHQHFSLVDHLTVWENVALGDEGRLDPGAVRARIGDISDQYGLSVEPDAIVGDLPAGLRQRVEIVKCLRRDPTTLIFDEPTSVLTPEESHQLFATLRQVVTAEQRAVALVSHKLDEVLHATDEVTIMRQGVVVDRMATADADAPTLARAMVGRPVSLRSERTALGLLETDPDERPEPNAPTPGTGQPALDLDGIVVRARRGRPLLDRLSLTVASGEIVGVAGVEGNGQQALVDLLSSLVSTAAGRVTVGGHEVDAGVPGAMAKAGVAVIPADRHDSGIVLDMSVAENLFLVDPRQVARFGIMDPVRMRAEAAVLIDQFDIQCWGPDAPLWSLSGGNQQRVVLARELSQSPKLLVAAQPTRGLDVGAIDYMTERLRAAAADGVGVLLISSELEEILDLSHRITVLVRGRIIGEMDQRAVDIERLGLLMGGEAA